MDFAEFVSEWGESQCVYAVDGTRSIGPNTGSEQLLTFFFAPSPVFFKK